MEDLKSKTSSVDREEKAAEEAEIKMIRLLPDQARALQSPACSGE